MSLKNSERIALGIFLFFTIVPLSTGLLYALLYSLGLAGALHSGFTLLHWKAVLGSWPFWYSLLASASIAAVSLLCSVVLALRLTLFFEKNAHRRPKAATAVFYLPLGIPPVIGAFLGFQLLGSSGMLARVAHAVGLIANSNDFPALINDRWYIGVMVTQVLMTFPLLVLLFTDVYKKYNIGALSQMASTLGATGRQAIRRVVLPVLLQKAQPNLVLCFIVLMSSYEIPLLLGRQSPMMLSVLIGQKFQRFNLADIPQAYAMTVLYAGLLMLLVAFSLKTKPADA